MKLLQKLKTNFSKDRETLKTLSLRQKIRFILDYYKGYAFILACCCAAAFLVGDAWLQAHRDTVLEGFFSNDDANLFPAKEIASDFSEFLRLTPGKQVVFDDSLYVILGSSAEYNTASQSKIIAYISARELDFLVTTKDLTEYYCGNFPLYDLEELLPDQLNTRLKDQLYYATDGNGGYKACAVSLAGSRFAPADDAEPHYLMVFSYTKHQDAMVRFLEYAFQETPS